MVYEVVEKMFEGENPKSIFEVGCANGSLFKDYADRNKLKVGGLDIFPVNGARVQYPEYADNFIQFDAMQDNWPILDNSYDIVFTVGTFTILKDYIITIKEMLRICKDKIILAEVHNETEREENTGGGYNCRYTRNYKKVFEDMGLKADIVAVVQGKTIIKCLK